MTANEHDRDRRTGRPVIRFFKAPEWGLVAGILAVLALIYVLGPASTPSSRTYSRQTLIHRVALFGVLAVGAALVIIAGGIDLSTGAVVALSSVVSAKLLTDWLRAAAPGRRRRRRSGSIALAIGLTLLLGLAIGLFHALHDQPAPAAAVHRDAGDDGRAAEPGGDPLPRTGRSTSRSTGIGSSAAIPWSRWRSSRSWPWP